MIFLPFLLCFCFGCLLTFLFLRLRIGNFVAYANDLLNQAQQDGQKWLEQKKAEWEKTREDSEQIHHKELQRHEQEHKRQLEKLREQKAQVADEYRSCRQQAALLSKEKEQCLQEQAQTEREKQIFLSLQDKYRCALVASLETSSEGILNQLRQEYQGQLENELTAYRTSKERELQEESQRRSCQILATAMQRINISAHRELLTTSIALAREEMKSWIIGREGRNIRAFEQATGVNLLIDEAPATVTLSGFDPLRRAIAKQALQILLSEGRIFPSRIEAVVEEAKEEIEKEILARGQDAAARVGAYPLHPEIHRLLGKLYFRTSLGQNTLEHSVEVATIMGLLAAELGLDIRLAKRIGLLHDIGKAVSHEKEQSHAQVGYNLAREYGESEEVANGIGCHHHEMEPLTIEGSLCHTADAISAGRPGARSEVCAEYIRRIEALETIAASFPGVEKAYAMQAGKEIVIIAAADVMNDQGVRTLAREVTKKIEQELRFPGKIKVTVIREKRIIHYAT